jgi:hypothetical protein
MAGTRDGNGSLEPGSQYGRDKPVASAFQGVESIWAGGFSNARPYLTPSRPGAVKAVHPGGMAVLSSR